ncbi:MAG TPA: hypothetical protein VF614_13530 [Chthoniobacteraceae bacterium]|jgi:hypothetical protein
MTAPPTLPLCYPARPIDGGRHELASPKVGTWYAEPKINGWRTLVHAPSGTMWNRHGKLLSIAGEFSRALAELAESPHEWFDCEGLERRHAIGKGALIVLDLPASALPYEERNRLLQGTFCPLLGGVQGAVHSIPSFTNAAATYALLQEDNRHVFRGVEFYEGIVMKRHGSLYPRQRLSPERATGDWIKHRWAF